MPAGWANESAPKRLKRPVTSHTASARRSLPTSRAISAGTMKIAEPIMMPTTIEVAPHNPSARTSCGGSGLPGQPGGSVPGVNEFDGMEEGFARNANREVETIEEPP